MSDAVLVAIVAAMPATIAALGTWWNSRQLVANKRAVDQVALKADAAHAEVQISRAVGETAGAQRDETLSRLDAKLTEIYALYDAVGQDVRDIKQNGLRHE
jgi:hypothetical protein